MAAGWQDLAAAQDGVLARQQALAGGMSEAAWRWRLHSGRWTALLPGVAVLQSGPPDERQQAWAAVLSCGAGAALTGDAALRLWGMTLPEPDPWRVAVPARRLVAPQEAGALRVQPHRVVALADVRHHLRLPPVVRPAAAVVHALARARTDRAAGWRVAAAVQQRVVTAGQVREVARLLRRVGRRHLLAEVLDDVALGAHARSELDLLRVLREAGLPLPDQLQRPVRRATGPYYLDAWWERQRIGLEVDGAAHRDAAAWGADLLRANDLAVAHRDRGVLLLRVTAAHLRHDRRRVVEQLRAVLGRVRGSVLGAP